MSSNTLINNKKKEKLMLRPKESMLKTLPYTK